MIALAFVLLLAGGLLLIGGDTIGCPYCGGRETWLHGWIRCPDCGRIYFRNGKPPGTR